MVLDEDVVRILLHSSGIYLVQFLCTVYKVPVYMYHVGMCLLLWYIYSFFNNREHLIPVVRYHVQ